LETWLEREEAPAMMRQTLQRMESLEASVREMAAASAASEKRVVQAAESIQRQAVTTSPAPTLFNGNSHNGHNGAYANGRARHLDNYAHHQGGNGRAAALRDDAEEFVDDHTEDLFGGGFPRPANGNGNGNGHSNGNGNGHSSNAQSNGNGNGNGVKASVSAAKSPASNGAGRREAKKASARKSPSAKSKPKAGKSRLREERRSAVREYLAEQADDSAVTPPLGRTTMQEATGITAKGVQTAIKDLIDAGEIAIEQEARGAQGHQYRVVQPSA
jgi:hypothetical protein